MRSGPYFLMVWTWAAATISDASSQLVRTRPPLPRACLYARAVSGFSDLRPGQHGSPVLLFASRYAASNTPRT